MIVSEARRRANRENATHSTGPTTPGGVEISSRNHTVHGLTARTVVLKCERQEDFDALLAGIMKDKKPQTTLGIELAQEVASGAFKLRRADRIEAEMFNSGTLENMDKFRRYRTSIEKGFYKAQDQLEKELKRCSKPKPPDDLQSIRKQHLEQLLNSLKVGLLPVVPEEEEDEQDEQNGFESQNEEVGEPEPVSSE